MTGESLLLGVNIDHVATLRQARGGRSPDPLHAALVAEQWGADSITLHLREDRRHIQDRDVRAMRGALQTRMNLEIAATAEMIAIALDLLPADVCLVPVQPTDVTAAVGAAVTGHAETACVRLRPLVTSMRWSAEFVASVFGSVRCAAAHLDVV